DGDERPEATEAARRRGRGRRACADRRGVRRGTCGCRHGRGECSRVGAKRERIGAPAVTLHKLTPASRVRIGRVAVWRNWQTQQTQNLPELCSVWVQVPPPPPKFSPLFVPRLKSNFAVKRRSGASSRV